MEEKIKNEIIAMLYNTIETTEDFHTRMEIDEVLFVITVDKNHENGFYIDFSSDIMRLGYFFPPSYLDHQAINKDIMYNWLRTTIDFIEERVRYYRA